MVTPVVQALHAAGAEGIVTVTERAFERIFTTMPEVTANLSLDSANPSYWEAVRVGLQARKLRCDTALILRFSHRAAVIARIAGCRVRVSAIKPKPLANSHLTKNLYGCAGWEAMHQVERYYAVAEAATGLKLSSCPLRYLPEPADLSGVLRLKGIPSPAVVVHLGNGGSARAWPDSAFMAVIEGLRSYGFGVVVTGAKGEIDAYPLSRASAHVDLVGQTGLDALAEVFRHSALVIAAGGGGIRVADAVGAPLLCLAIGTRWSPHQERSWTSPSVILQSNAFCEGCQPGRCHEKGTACLTSLTPDSVVVAALKMLPPGKPHGLAL